MRPSKAARRAARIIALRKAFGLRTTPRRPRLKGRRPAKDR